MKKAKPTKSIKILHWLDTGIFPATILFSYQFSYDEVIRLLKKKQASDWLAGISGDKIRLTNSNYIALHRELENTTTHETRKLFYIFIKEEFKYTDYEYCNLAHEVVHMCQYILPAILDRDKEHEAEAYLHTHIMSQLLEVLRGTIK